MKIEKETFRSGAETVGVIVKEVAVATTVSGLAMFGAAKCITGLGLGVKHPILGTICSLVSASIVSGMVMGTEKLQDWILDDAEYEAERLTNIIYSSDGVNKIIED